MKIKEKPIITPLVCILAYILLILSEHAALSAEGSDNISFGHLSVEDGLPHTCVYDMVQDHLGFLWFATEGGVAKYGGYRFTVYKHDPTNPNSLSDTAVYALYEDSRHYLWFGTEDGGLNRFDPV